MIIKFLDELPNKRPAFKRACTFLEEALREKRWSNERHFPSLNTLALQSGVSRKTIWEAVQKFKERGLIDIVRGGYISAFYQRSAQLDTKLVKQRWQKIKLRLERDILDGRFRLSKTLPLKRLLAQEFGCHVSTINKVLQSLEAEGVITQKGRTCYLSKVSHTCRSTASIALISLGKKHSGLSPFNDRMRIIIQGFERECQAAAIIPTSIPFDGFWPSAADYVLERLKPLDRYLGFIIALGAWYYESEVAHQRMNTIISALLATRQPVAIYEDMGQFDLSEFSVGHKSELRIFSIATKSAGKNAADHLLRLGHRCVGYLSGQFGHLWSRERFRGLSDTFENAGLTRAVTPFYLKGVNGKFEALIVLGNIDENIAKKILVNIPEDALATALNTISKVRSSICLSESPKVSRPVEIERIINLAIEIIEKKYPDYVINDLRNQLFSMAQEKAYWYYFEELFEEVLREKEITAWVCSCDLEALLAIQFLRKKKLYGKIAVIGFDNTIEAFQNNLTSYDFNIPNILENMFSFILRPNLNLYKTPNFIVTLNGMLIERESTLLTRK